MKKYFICFFIVLFVFSCIKKEPELVLTETNRDNQPVQQSEEAVFDETGKPLIMISKEDTLKIMVRQDGAPGMYMGDDGEVHGFYVDLEKLLMEVMGQKYELIPYSDVGAAIQGLKTGYYHNALSVPDLPDYRQFVNLSLPYERLHYTVFIRNTDNWVDAASRDDTIKSLFGKKVGVQARGHIYQVLIEYPEIDIIEYPTTTSALEDLDKGLLDAVPDVERIGKYYAEKNGWDIKPVGEPIISHKITTGFSKMLDPSIVDRYNAALKQIQDDGRYKTLYESYFGELKERDLP